MRPTVRAFFADRRTEILLFALLWCTYAYFYQSAQHNGAAHLDQTRAIVEGGVLWIDKYRYNTADVVTVAREGRPPHIYPNKAPGTSLLAVAPFWLWRCLLKVFGLREWVFWHAVAYLTILSTIGLLSALAAVAVFGVLKRASGDPVFSALAVVAVWLGTICFPFSTLFFSHQQAASQLAIAFWVLFRLRHDGPEKMRRPALQAALAGFLCGFTIATEYPTALLVALLCTYFAATAARRATPPRTRLALGGAFVGGLLGGLLILAAYNLAVSGKVFFIPYQTYARAGAASPFPGHREGFVGIHWPGWKGFLGVLAEITVRPQRGLLYLGFDGLRPYACSPVLWLALPGAVWLFLRGRFRLEAILAAAMAAAYFTFNACYGDSIVYWGGAWSVGPRHIIPLLPLLALPLVEGARRLWMVFYPLLLVSVFYMLLATAVEPRVPYEYRNPARWLFAANYLRGNLALNREGLFDPLSRPLTANSTAFNLAKLAGLPGSIQLLPLLGLWALLGSGLIWASWKAGETPEKKPPEGSAESEELLSLVFRPRFGPRSATAVLVLFTAAVAAAPPLHARRVKREIARPGGLLAKYYPNARWRGRPAFVRKDRRLDFDWTTDPPLPWPFSVEWVGTIRIPRAGRYVFATESDDGSYLALGGRLVVNNQGSHARRYAAGLVEIKRAGVYPIEIRYFNKQLGAAIRVTWRPPGEAERVVPADLLNPPGVEKERK